MRSRLRPRGRGAEQGRHGTATRRAALGLGLFVCLIGLMLASIAIAGHRHRDPLIVAGKVSVYGPPYEGAGTTANGSSSAEAGIALWGHSDTLGRYYCVTLHRGRLHAVLRHIDVGPAPWTGRAIDVTGAGVARLEGKGSFYTDASAHARLLPRKRGPEWRCGRR